MKKDIIINEENFKKFSKKLKTEINNLENTDIILSESKEILSRVFFRSSYHEIKRNFKENDTLKENENLKEDISIEEKRKIEEEKLKNEKKIKELNKQCFEFLEILDSHKEDSSYLLFSVKNGKSTIKLETYKHNTHYGVATKNSEKQNNMYIKQSSELINKTFTQDNLKYLYQCLYSEAAVCLDFTQSQYGKIELIKENGNIRPISKDDLAYNPFSEKEIPIKKTFYMFTLADIENNSYYFAISKNDIHLRNMLSHNRT